MMEDKKYVKAKKKGKRDQRFLYTPYNIFSCDSNTYYNKPHDFCYGPGR